MELEEPTHKSCWIINPITFNIEFPFKINKRLNWILYDAEQVRKGLSPLESKGAFAWETALMLADVNSSLWVFCDSYVSADSVWEHGKILTSVFRCFTHALVSDQAIYSILIDNKPTGPYSLPAPKSFSSCSMTKLNEENLDNIFELIDILAFSSEEIKNKYIHIFDHISECERASGFVGTLSLWSFIENYWAKEEQIINRSTSHSNSLDKLIISCYPDDKTQKRLVNSQIRAWESKLDGNTGLRNILAHGTYFTIKDDWDEEKWSLFYDFSNKLFNLVKLAVKEEIKNIT